MKFCLLFFFSSIFTYYTLIYSWRRGGLLLVCAQGFCLGAIFSFLSYLDWRINVRTWRCDAAWSLWCQSKPNPPWQCLGASLHWYHYVINSLRPCLDIVRFHFGLGPYPEMLTCYSWLFTQKLILAVLRGPYGMTGICTWVNSVQGTPFLLYYF